MHKLSITTIIILLMLLPFSIFGQIAHAQSAEIQTFETLGLDTTIIREDENFILPSQIIVAPVFMPNSSENITPEEQVRGLFYFTIQKLGFSDVPFHYLVTEEGDIISGNSGGDERKVKIEGLGEDVILVGYITDKQANSFSKRSTKPLTNLLQQIVNRNRIDPKDIAVSGIEFVRDETAKTVTIASKKAFGTWDTDLTTIQENLGQNYNPTPKTYNIQVASSSGPTGQVQPGTIVEYSITLSNTNNTGIYAGTDSELILSRTDADFSDFFVNNVWLSQTEVPIMEGDDKLLRLQEETFTFELRAPLYTGERSEVFELKTIEGVSVNAEPITISLNMSQPDKQIVEILNNAAGVVQVYRQAYGQDAFTQVSPGQRFFILDDIGNGWIEIDLGNNETGWIANWQVSYI